MSDGKNVENIVHNASALAAKLQHDYLSVEHVAACLLEDADVVAILKGLKCNASKLAAAFDQFFANGDHGLRGSNGYKGRAPRRTASVERVFQRAAAMALFTQRTHLLATDVLLSILDEDESWARFFFENEGITRETVTKFLARESRTEESQQMLKEYTVNLNEEAAAGRIDPLIGRDIELKEVIHVLARRKKNNIILVGPAGTGKTALAEGLALKIINGEVPNVLRDRVVYSLEIGNLLAGTRYRGDFEERIKALLEVLTNDPNAILFIDEIHMIMGAGGSNNNSMDVANLIKPVLGKGRMLTIGATTPDEYANSIEKDRALLRRFARLDINETDVPSTKLILRGCREQYEQFHGVSYQDELLDAAVDLADRYIKSKHFPDKALDIIDASGAATKLRGSTKVLMKDIVQAVSKISKIGEDAIDVERTDGFRNLESRMKQKVFGQDGAVNKLVESVILAKSGLREANKPIGSFLFVGPTGTGKTETARALASELQTTLVKFDMSEYQERHTVSRLIGAPPGYVGHAEGKMGSGQLLAAVKDNPNCVLLLDEVEKAAPEVLQVLLQVMDDGRLTGGTGETVDFSNVVLLMTSNLGAADAERLRIGFGNQSRDGDVMEAVERFFTPEFRNRLDGIVRFSRLTENLMDQIVRRLETEVNELLNKNGTGIRVKLSEAAIRELARVGYDPSMGARPLKRKFEELVKKPLSQRIVFDRLANTTVKVGFTGGEFKFTTSDK